MRTSGLKTEILVKGMEKTEAVEQFLLSQIDSFIHPLVQGERGGHIRFIVTEVSHRMQARKPKFLGEVHVKMDSSSKVFKVAKTSDDFYACVHEVGLAMRNALQRYRGKRQVHSRFAVTTPAVYELEGETTAGGYTAA